MATIEEALPTVAEALAVAGDASAARAITYNISDPKRRAEARARTRALALRETDLLPNTAPEPPLAPLPRPTRCPRSLRQLAQVAYPLRCRLPARHQLSVNLGAVTHAPGAAGLSAVPSTAARRAECRALPAGDRVGPGWASSIASGPRGRPGREGGGDLLVATLDRVLVPQRRGDRAVATPLL